MARRLSVGQPPRNIYPYPPFDEVLIRVVVKAIRMAWIQIALEEHQAPVGTERDEVALNYAMTEKINEIRSSTKIPGFTSKVFETVVVDAPTKDFTGNRINSRPDITIRLQNIRPGVANPTIDAIFIECKRLRQVSNFGKYFSSGMDKFLQGQYAWAVSQAIMIGYVETSRKLPDALQIGLERLDRPSRAQVVPYKARLVRPSGQPYAAFTRHRRTWQHPNEDHPGDIELTHVWLWYTD